MSRNNQKETIDVLMHSGFTRPFTGPVRHFDPYRIRSVDATKTMRQIIDIVSDDYQGVITATTTLGLSPLVSGIQGEHIWSMTDTAIFRRRFLEMLTIGVPVLDAFQMSYWLACRLLESYGMADGRDDDELLQGRETFVKRIQMTIARAYLDDFVNTWTEDGVLMIKDVFPTYALSLSDRVVGIITTETPGHSSISVTLFETLGIPVVFVSKGIDEGTNIYFDPWKRQIHLRVFESHRRTDPVPTHALDVRQLTLIPVVNDTRLSAYERLSPWFKGAALTDTSVWTVSTGRPLVRAAQEDILKAIIRVVGDTRFHIRMPDFSPMKSPFPLDEKQFSDPAMLMAYKAFFKTQLCAVKEILDPIQTSFILPFLGHPEEMLVWSTIILEVYKQHGKGIPKIGVMIESEPLVEAYEAFDAADYVIFNLDRITMDLYDNLEVPSVMWTLKTTVRDMHQRSRERHVDHYVMGRVLSHPQVMDRVLKMGFRQMMIPPSDLFSVATVIDGFLGNKDKYKGVHARRMAVLDTMIPVKQ
ncbi:MAG: hypothetical protein K9K93_00845 [Acholeplasmataceae bacterium]|nr:hypothetical protein [Acholeplasmataceae bacterium]